MRFALLLLWLTILAPAAHAADWLTWRRVGEATLTWGPFTVYHSQLRTPNGRYDGPQQDRALIITYRRDIDREALVEALFAYDLLGFQTEDSASAFRD